MPEKDKSEDVSSTSEAYDEMHPEWCKIWTLMGGTPAMRRAGTLYLPQHPREANSHYSRRLETNTLLNILELTVKDWVGKVFAKPIKFEENVPQEIQSISDDVDRLGTDLGSFMRDAFRMAVTYGVAHILIDNPIIENDGTRTRESDAVEGVRPHWSLINPWDLIFAHADIEGGKEVLRHVRVREESFEMDGFTHREVNRIRVYEPGVITTYIEVKDSEHRETEWVLDTENPPIAYNIPFIPIFTFYYDKKGLMLSKIPVGDLADLNIEHWQMSSDLRSIVTAASFPLLARAGGSLDPGEEIEIGPYKVLHTSDPQGKWYYVEHSGAAINVGRSYLQSLEDRMGLYGAEFLSSRPGATTSNVEKTATQSVIEQAAVISPLEDVALRFKDFVERLLDATAQIAGLGNSPGIGGTIDMPVDLSESSSNKDMDYLVRAREMRDISRDTLVKEMARRDILSEDYDADADAELIRDEPLAGGFTEREIDLIEREQRRGRLRDIIEPDVDENGLSNANG